MISNREPCGSRRFAVVVLLLGFLLAATSARGQSLSAAPEPAPPNVILIFADDLGYGDLEVYFQCRIATPNLTRMAGEGLTFGQFYSAAPLCPPARNGLLAGLHTGHTVVRESGILPPDSAAVPRYLPRLLQGAGYVTGVIGKWGMGAHEPAPGGARATAGRPEELGFDEFLGFLTHRDAHTYTLPPYPLRPADEPIHDRLWRIAGGRTVEHPATTVPYVEETFIAAALDFLERHQADRFFLYLPLTLPHAELHLPASDESWQPYLDAGGRSLFPEHPFPGDRTYRRPNDKPRATYAAMVSRLDRDVGRLLDKLGELGLDEQTLVVFTSDNGPHDAGGIRTPTYFESTAGLRGMKWSLYEGGIRVPALARWPGTIAAGSVSTEPAALWDLMPTILDLAGIAPPPGLDGVSLRPLLTGGTQPPRSEDKPLYWETFNARFRGQAARAGKWKAVRLGVGSATDRVQLFDLAADVVEQTDRAADPAHCATLLHLVGILNTAREDPGPPFSIAPLTVTCTSPDGLLFVDDFESGHPSSWQEVLLGELRQPRLQAPTPKSIGDGED